jgi:hypothetical protein
MKLVGTILTLTLAAQIASAEGFVCVGISGGGGYGHGYHHGGQHHGYQTYYSAYYGPGYSWWGAGYGYGYGYGCGPAYGISYSVPLYSSSWGSEYRPNYLASGAFLGGLIGGVVGSQDCNGWEGAMIGTAAGLIVGGIAEAATVNHERRRQNEYVMQAPAHAPAQTDAPAAPANTLANDVASTPAAYTPAIPDAPTVPDAPRVPDAPVGYRPPKRHAGW